MWNYLAQTDTTVRGLTSSPGVIAGVALFAVLVCGFALVRVFLDQLKLPIAQRTLGGLLVPYLTVVVAVVFELAALFTVVGLPFNFTLTVSLPLMTIVGVLVWQRFLYRAITQLPGPTEPGYRKVWG
ncbi:hypothetical protein [Anthocerotibacter panamensis]|uniref:hypothetical protein n=1 Tax=Anthocerotibacter panamensis TaxID=2857077 RepID=UPI001C403FC8|nr:hypothetical protein [Anthocerotibacter panamensis]